MKKSKAPLRVGVLALQGDFSAHVAALEEIGVEVVEVRRAGQLDDLSGLVIPGGESTTLLRLFEMERFEQALRRFHARGGGIFGTCAGLILLAREIANPAQTGLGLLDVSVSRNAFGRQIESFVDRGPIRLPGEAPAETEMVFIRAPRILEHGSAVEVLGEWKGEPVLVLQDRVLAATFHPEMSADRRIHRFFLGLLREGRPDRTESLREPL